MKKIILIILTLISINLFAQKKGANKEVIGSPYEFKAQNKYQRVFFENVFKIKNEYYAVGILRTYDVNLLFIFGSMVPHNSDFKLFKLDEKMNVKSMATLSVEVMDKDLESIDIKMLGDQLCAFYYFNNRKQFKQYLFTQLINPSNLKPIGKMMKIAETPITKKQKNISPIFNIRFSPDNKLILITNDKTIAPRTRRERRAAEVQKNHKINFWIYNEKMELVNFVKEFSFGKGNTEFLDVAFDNQGNIGFIGFEKIETKSKSKKIDKDKSEVTGNSIILKIVKKNNEEIVLKIAEKLQFTSARMVYNPNTNNIALVGLLYAAGGSNGIYTEQINLETGELVNENEIKFSKDLIKAVDKISRSAKREEPTSKRKQKKQDKRDKKRDAAIKKMDYIENLTRLGECYYNDSNELIVVAQQFYWYAVTTTTTDSKGRTTTTTNYYYVYNDIITFKLDDQAELEEFGIVPHHNVFVNFQVYKDYYALYNSEDIYVYSGFRIGKVNFNNKASDLKPIKNIETFTARKTYNEVIIFNDRNVLLANKSKKKITFGLLSI